MTAPHGTHRHDDRGAALILAIGFILLISAIVGGLAALITSSLDNRGTLDTIRNRQYAADAGIQDAITQVRSVTNRTSALACDPSAPLTYVPFTTALNSSNIRVDCAKAFGVAGSTDNYVLAQRNVIFTACVDTGSACTTANVIIRAQVDFEQKYAGAVTTTFVQSWSVNQ
ncbi:unannotated protein [freshwater metagenome]|uniref:Unannotated protein n=1 Tax=freshwater metagenome TaxID=449393 RepID=A0A6J7EPT3_9ZZZZ|nr:hypothetical protein [Actinomycetota bacterium]